MEQVDQQSAPEVTPHEQAMMDLVDDTASKASAQADPESAPEYVEETPEATDEIDYKAEYEKLKEAQETPKTPEEVPKNLEVPEDAPKAEEEVSKQLTPEQMSEYTKEFASDGVLSEGSYADLEKLGLSKSVVDTYIQGQEAIQEAQTNKVYESVGGAEEYNSMITWAKESLSEEQIRVFNSQVNSGDPATVMFGVDALKAHYTAAQGSPIPKRGLRGSTQAAAVSQGYENKQEMFKAMRNPSYGKDASYTRMVESKIGLSSF